MSKLLIVNWHVCPCVNTCTIIQVSLISSLFHAPAQQTILQLMMVITSNQRRKTLKQQNTTIYKVYCTFYSTLFRVRRKDPVSVALPHLCDTRVRRSSLFNVFILLNSWICLHGLLD